METKKLMLHSLNVSEYSDLEIECLKVENIKEYVEMYLAYNAIHNKKTGQARISTYVKAHQAKMGEIVDNRPIVERNGKRYIIGNTVTKIKDNGLMVVQNLNGECEVVNQNDFAKKYKPTNESGIYKVDENPILFVMLHQDIAFTSSNGKTVYGLKGGVLNITDLDNISVIQKENFKNMYVEQQKNEEAIL